MIYDINGNQLTNAYDINGNLLTQAYDLEGNPLMEDEPTPPTPIQSNFKVMSYNVQYWGGMNANTEMLQTIINTYDVDVIGTQEGSGTAGGGLFSDYGYSEASGNLSLISKYALGDFVAANYTDGRRGYIKAYIQFNGKRICIIDTHLETGFESVNKIAEAQQLFELVQNEDYFIITGDFNTTCKSVNAYHYNVIYKQFVDAGYHLANCSNQHGFIDTWTDGTSVNDVWFPTDNIITSANIDIVNVIADTLKVDVAAQTGQSIDHLPVIACLAIY